MSWTDADVVSSSAPAWSDEDVTTPEKKSRLRKAAESFLPSNIVKQGYGALETATQMGSGALGAASGGLTGLGTILTGGGVDKAADRIHSVQNAMTYAPRTEHGKIVSEFVNLPFETARKGYGEIGNLIDDTHGRDLGEAGFDVVNTLLGGKAALRAAPIGPTAMQSVRNAGETVAKAAKEVYDPSLHVPTAAEVRKSYVNAPIIDAANIARKNNMAIDPTAVNPTRWNRLGKALSGEENLANALAKENRGKAARPLRQEIGLDPDLPPTVADFERVRSEAAAPHREIETLQTLTPDSNVIQSLNSLRPDSPLIGGKPAYSAQLALTDEAIQRIASGEMSGAEALKNISGQRKQARDIYNSLESDPIKQATADTRMGIANALEQLIEGNLKDNPQLLQQYRDGRTRMAQSYVLEDITDLNTGAVDMKKLAKLTSKDNALTGSFAEGGKLAGVMPEALTVGAESTMPMHGSSRTILGLAGGAAADLAAKIIGKRVAARMASPEYQAKNATPVDYRPMRERMGYDALPPEPPPLSLAPEGEALPTTRANVEPAVRETMGFAPEAAIQSQALRGQGARTPLGSMDFPSQAPNPNAPAILQQPANAGRAGAPVEFTPGGGMDFKTPVQKVHELPIEIQSEIQKYTKQAQNAMSQAEADQAMMMVEALKSMGTQEGLASNLQPMYQGSNPAGYPIQKTFDPRSEALRRR